MHPTLSRPCLLVDTPLVLFCPLIRYSFASLVGVTKCLTHVLSASSLVLQRGSGWPFMTSTLFPRMPNSRGSLLTSHPWTKWFMWAMWGLPLTPINAPRPLRVPPPRKLLLETIKLLETSRAVLLLEALARLLKWTLGRLLASLLLTPHRPRVPSLPRCPLVPAHTEWNPRKPNTRQPSFICRDPQTISFPSLMWTVTVAVTSTGDSITSMVMVKRTLKTCPYTGRRKAPNTPWRDRSNLRNPRLPCSRRNPATRRRSLLSVTGERAPPIFVRRQSPWRLPRSFLATRTTQIWGKCPRRKATPRSLPRGASLLQRTDAPHCLWTLLTIPVVPP